MKAKEIQAPHEIACEEGYVCVFLAGSIEMGKAEEWQRKLINDLQDENYIFLNPRRNDWDSTWEQKITNPNFYEQVNWELNALECSDVIVMYFDPNTMSPITLLELGIHAKSRKLIVYCPEGFWRKGNVDIVCEKYNIKQVDSFEELKKAIKNLV